MINIEDINYSPVESDLSIKMTKDQKIQVLKLDGKMYKSCKQCSYSTTKAFDLKSHLLVHAERRLSVVHSAITLTKQLETLRNTC